VKRVGLLVVLVLGASFAATAGPFAVGPHLGYTFGGDVEESSAVVGAQCTYALDEQWSLELAVSQYTEETKETERWDGGAGGAIWITDYDLIPIALSLVYTHAPGDGVALYAGGGVALYLVDIEGSAEPLAGSATTSASLDIEADSGYGVQGMLGCAYDASQAIEAAGAGSVALSLFADLRLAWAVYDYEATYAGVDAGSPWLESEDDTSDYVHAMVRVGAGITF